MFTGYQVSSSGGSTFEGNIVIFENRPFGIDCGRPTRRPGHCRGDLPGRRRDGRRGDLRPQRQRRQGRLWRRGGPHGAVALVFDSRPTRWCRPGDWIADVTYERNALIVYNSQTQSGDS